jgi:hypothetical protein
MTKALYIVAAILFVIVAIAAPIANVHSDSSLSVIGFFVLLPGVIAVSYLDRFGISDPVARIIAGAVSFVVWFGIVLFIRAAARAIRARVS